MNPLTRGSIAFALLLVASQTRGAAEEHPDQVVQPNVPQGKVTSGQFADSKIYPGTKREFSVYVPAQYKPDEPAALMVFMDGGVSDAVYEEARREFSERELADLTWAVVAINGWNRLNVAFRTMPGAYKPHLRAQLEAQLTGPPARN